jgi:4-amino-4-deoxy-L-arabinose transferase-like glycosyltransferase
MNAPPALEACHDPAAGSRRHRLAFWKSPDGQPPWARPTLLGIAAFAAFLYSWHLANAGLAPFYSTAVKSMSESWKAFFYGAFDPAATVTIDKLAGSFLPQALSARIFGFHPWSLALPQVIEGVISVLVLYRVVRRWAGVTPGLIAAGIFALTPIAASMFGHSMEDGALTMCLVLAADAYQLAVSRASQYKQTPAGRSADGSPLTALRPLIGAAAWVGAGFQAKMLQAWMILPALGIGYLIAAPARLRRRLWQLAAAAAVMLAVSLSWIMLYTFTPASDRPYIDGSTTNNAFSMVFGYNGLERFGIKVPGAVSSGPGVSGSARTGGAGATGLGGSGAAADGGAANGGAAKLAGSRFGPEIGWLYPLALGSLGFGLWSRRRTRRTDPTRAGLLMWGTWLGTFGVIYSAMSNIPHTAYVASLAPPIAALSGAGIAAFWQWYRSAGRLGWVLPGLVAAELGWAVYLWSAYPTFLPWVLWATVVVGIGVVAVLVLARLPGRARPRISGRLTAAAMITAVAVMVAAPATWAMSVLDTQYAGSSFDAAAGPAGAFNGSGGRGGLAGLPGRGSGGLAGRPAGLPDTGGPPPSGTGGPGGGFGRLRAGGTGAAGGIQASATTTLTTAERQIYRYVSAHGDGAAYLLAVQSWTAASPYILATGQEIMPLGGFSGSVPSPTLAHFRELVKYGQLKYVLLGGTGQRAGPSSASGDSQATAITRWVERSCKAVPARDYGAGSANPQTLYECSSAS